MRSWYDTINASVLEAERRNKKAMVQEGIIMVVFKKSRAKLTRNELDLLLMDAGYDYPETSLSRALSNLTGKGLLVKSVMAERVGKYGINCHTWRVAR